MMKVGSNIPEQTVQIVVNGEKKEISTLELFQGKTILFGLPGAYTPVCSGFQLPGFAREEANLRKNGYQKIICMAVNDAFVMQSWKEQVAPNAEIIMLADGNAALTKSLGIELDLDAKYFGLRCKRFLAVIEDAKFSLINIEEDSTICAVSSVDSLL